MPTTALAIDPLTEDEEELIDLFYEDINKFAISDVGFPPCSQGGKCECPRTKADPRLGLRDHKCNPDPKSDCIVRVHVFRKGVRA